MNSGDVANSGKLIHSTDAVEVIQMSSYHAHTLLNTFPCWKRFERVRSFIKLRIFQ